MSLLTKEIHSVCSEIIPSSEAARNSASDGDVMDDDEDDCDMMAALRRKRIKLSNVEATTSNDPVQSQVERFFSQSFDLGSVMSGQQNQPVLEPTASKVGSTLGEWLENIETVAKCFDVMEWWRRVGKKSYPLIYPVACCILALPDSNGDQERTFSAATWMDGKLSTKQNDITFQMKVMACKNSEFLDRHKGRVKGEHMKAAAERTKKLLMESSKEKNSEDDDSDSEVEHLLEAFGDVDEGSAEVGKDM